MKLWETEKFTLNLKTGELMRSLSNMYIQGENFEHAHKRLIESEMDWLRLTGNWFLDSSEEDLKSDISKENKFDKFDWRDNAFNFGEPEDDDDSTEEKPPEESKTFVGYEEKDWQDFLKAKIEFLESLDLDQILDWLTTLDKEQVDDVWKTCIEYGLLERVKVVEGYLKYRYGKKDEEGLQ
jgi:hypothetical protein